MTQQTLFADHYAQHTLGNPAKCSGQKTTSQIIFTGRVLLASVILLTDGTNDATLTIYDNTAGTGKVIRKFTVAGDENFGGNTLRYPVHMGTGIYAAVSGTGASFIIDYIEREL